MDYQVVLPVFEGPLDLLLHLIDANELDIYNIPIAFITGQYIQYMKAAEEIDLNVSGEFVLMAGTLLTIKARLLLPKREMPEATEEEADPRSELIEKLIEYRMFKQKADEFKGMAANQAGVYFRLVDDKALLQLIPKPNPIGNLSTADLTAAFMELMQSSLQRQQSVQIPKDEVTLHNQAEHILRQLRKQPEGLSFRALLTSDSLRLMITTFMALLELMHRSKIWVKQKVAYGEIFVFLAEERMEDNADDVVYC
jgi:segregation and condensation protein A